MAAERPELQIAWQHRHITNEQIAAADREFRQLEILYQQSQAAPNEPRKLAASRQLEQRGQQLGYMLNARTMLDRAWKDVVKPPHLDG
jgi:hypothetical protein